MTITKLDDLRILIYKNRMDKGLTLQQLSDLSGISKNTIRRIESGKNTTFNTLLDLAKCLDIRVIAC